MARLFPAAARRWIVAAMLLGLGRALGEAVAVFLIVGRQDSHWPGVSSLATLGPLFQSGQTLTSKLASAEVNIAYGVPLHWAAVVSLGLILLAMATVCTVAADRLTAAGRK